MQSGEDGYVDEIAMMRRKDMDMFFFISSINSSSSFQGGYPTEVKQSYRHPKGK